MVLVASGFLPSASMPLLAALPKKINPKTNEINTIKADMKYLNTQCEFDPKAKTAIMLVSGFNGLGLHTLFGVIRLFGKEFRNFIFVEIGIIDAGNFKGVEELGHLKTEVVRDVDRYAAFMQEAVAQSRIFMPPGSHPRH